MTYRFKAPWSRTLVVTSIFVTIVLLGSAVVAVQASFFAALVCMAVLVGSALTTVRGYAITTKAIEVKRLMWSTALPRDGIKQTRVIDRIPWTGHRLVGNGGAFAFSGLYWNRELGRYRAFLTRNKDCVLIEYEKRKVVVSPDDPQKFVAALAR